MMFASYVNLHTWYQDLARFRRRNERGALIAYVTAAGDDRVVAALCGRCDGGRMCHTLYARGRDVAGEWDGVTIIRGRVTDRGAFVKLATVTDVPRVDLSIVLASIGTVLWCALLTYLMI